MSEYSSVEKPFLDQLAELGWEVVDHGPGVPGDPTLSHRTSFRECALKGVFKTSVRALNTLPDGRAWLTDKQLDDVFDEIAGQPVRSLLEANEAVLKLLFKHTVDRNELTGEEFPEIKLIDFDAWARNRFIANNQFRIDTPGHTKNFIIPDIVLFVNGLPFVVVECKVPSSVDANPMHECFKQLMRYSDQREESKIAGLREGEPRLFHCNQLLIRTTGDEADYGSITSTEDTYFFPWRDIHPAKYKQYTPPLSVERAQEKLIQGMLPPETLLDLVRNFTIFMEAGNARVKVVCRYQQYRAVVKIIGRLRTGQTPLDRSGVIWHTQGSGKSLTMVFAIRKLRRCEDLKDFKILMVNDRSDLERQLTDTAKLTGETVTVIESTADLKTRLATPSSNLNMVMVHKFRDSTGTPVSAYLAKALKVPVFDAFGVVSTSERILVMIDEAHRTQGSDPEGSLSDNLFDAFPNATRLAFTGTPLIADRHSKKTYERFGGYIDKYKLRDAVADRATVNILYEGRTADTAINQKAEFDTKHESMIQGHVAAQMQKEQNIERVQKMAQRERRVFEDLFKELSDAEILALKKKYGATGDILEAEGRIKEIAADLVEHYVEHILPNGFKAQVVCSSKMAAIHYKTYIDAALTARLAEEQARPDGERDDALCQRLAFLKSAVIVSSDGTNEKAVITAARKASRELNAVKNFLKSFNTAVPETGIAFLIVCDMLLTGFDAPIEQVMYIDKKIQEHNLLQTIARVNRTAKRKEIGYIVDYIGLTNYLRTALKIYAEDDEADALGALKNITTEIPILEDRYRRILQLFQEKGLAEIEGFANQTLASASQDAAVCERAVELLKDIKTRAEFEVRLKVFFRSMDIVLPNASAGPYKIPARRFAFLFMQARQRYKDESLDITGIGEKVRKLVNDHLISLGINPKIPPVELLSPTFVKELDKNVTPKAKASEMEHAIRKHLKIHFEEDPAFYQKLSVKLEALIKKYKDDWDELCKALSGVRDDAQSGRRETVAGVSVKAAPFYDLIGQIAFGADVPEAHADTVKALVTKILVIFKDTIGIINFWGNAHEQSRLRGTLSDPLLETGIDEIVAKCDQLQTELMALAKVRHQDILS
ncbi:MAG: HsdR family type I site-specific deoxyribonuclease [Planctomycetota bacterium]